MRSRRQLVVHGARVDRPALALLVALATHLRPVAASAAESTSTGPAHFAAEGDPAAAMRWARAGPTVAWLDEPALARHGLEAWQDAACAGVVLAGTRSVQGLEVVVAAPAARELAGFAWMPPLVRSRRRVRLGLPAPWVGDLRPAELVSDAAAREVMGSATVVTAEPRWVLPALACGLPVLVDEGAFAQLPGSLAGLVHLDHAGAAERTGSAALADPAAETRRSCTTSAAVHDRFDLTRIAAALARRLRDGTVFDPSTAVGDRLDELGTPAGSFVARRGAAAVSSLGAPCTRRTS